MTNAVTDQQEPVVQLKELHDCQRKVRHTLSPHVFALLPDSLAVKEQVTGWLSDDIKGIEKRLEADTRPAAGLPERTDDDEDDYEQLGVSVELYALHKRIQYEAGMIVNKNKTQMIRTIVRHTRRKDLAPISENSFRGAFYSPERKTVEAVRQFCKKMLLIANSM